MTKMRMMTLTATLLVVLAASAMGQVDKFAKLDTLYIETAPIDEHTWAVNILLTNDEWIDALTIPLHLDAGETKIIGDSAVYTGGRVVDFDLKGFRADTAIQCVTMGLMASMGPEDKGLPPGKGRLVTVFVSSVDKMPIKELKVDTTTTHPTNTLMAVAQRVQLTDPPDTVANFDDCRIIPVLVIQRAE